MALERYKNVLIIGGTGGLGRHIVRGFLNHGGFNVNVLVRPNTLENADGNKRIILTEHAQRGANLLTGDIYEHESLVDVMKGIDVVVTAISSIAPDAKEQHLSGEINLIEAAKAANVKYFIPAEFGGDSRIIGDVGYELFSWNRHINEVLAASGMEYTSIYTSIFTQYLIWFFTSLNLKTRSFDALESLDFQMSTITEEDIGNLLPHIALAPSTKNQHIKLAGDVVSMRQLGELYSEAFGPIQANVLTREAVMKGVENPETVAQFKFTATAILFQEAFCFTDSWNQKYLPNYKPITIKKYLKRLKKRDQRARL